MTRSKTNTRRSRSPHTLKDKGLAVAALGLVMLTVPWFAASTPTLIAVANGLRTPGWLALGAGLLLLGFHYFIQDKLPELMNFRSPASKPPAVPARASKPRRREPTMAPAPPLSAQLTWSPAVFAAIEWRRFEAVCEALFSQAGFETRSQSHGADGGVDIWLHSANADGPVAVVQCKHWHGKSVGVKELREFFGVMTSHQLKRGTYATTSTYSSDAQAFAKATGINAMDGLALLALIDSRTPEQQQALLAVAFEGEYWRPTCASCGIKLKERKPSKGGPTFWGCSNYPRCKSRLPMAAALR